MDCQVSTWSAWSPCSETCGRGVQDRYREIVVPPQNGGSSCPPRMEQRRKCQVIPCRKYRAQIPLRRPWYVTGAAKRNFRLGAANKVWVITMRDLLAKSGCIVSRNTSERITGHRWTKSFLVKADQVRTAVVYKVRPLCGLDSERSRSTRVLFLPWLFTMLLWNARGSNGNLLGKLFFLATDSARDISRLIFEKRSVTVRILASDSQKWIESLGEKFLWRCLASWSFECSRVNWKAFSD